MSGVDTLANLSEAIQKLTEAGVQVVQEDRMEKLGLSKDQSYSTPWPELLRSFSRIRTGGSMYRLVQATIRSID
jgi:hypothetical protein